MTIVNCVKCGKEITKGNVTFTLYKNDYTCEDCFDRRDFEK